MNKEMKKVIKVAEELGWTISESGDGFYFQKDSPAHQDFFFEVEGDGLEKVLSTLKERIENYDCSYEAFIWLDNTGHGKYGAPHDMKDLYEDMEACLKNMKELLEALKQMQAAVSKA